MKSRLLLVCAALAWLSVQAHAQQITDPRFIYEAENVLKSQGFLDLGVPNDGTIGPNTRTAIRNYQGHYRLPVDGVFTVQLLRHMRGDRGPSTRPLRIHSGDVEYIDIDDIRRGQMLLQNHGFSLTADGVIGMGTRRALAIFQSNEGMEVDGRLTPHVMERLQVASFVQRAPSERYITCFNGSSYGSYVGRGSDDSAAKDAAYGLAYRQGFRLTDCSEEGD